MEVLLKGYALTPTPVVDLMVGKLFGDGPPHRDARVLDPGCGTGVFIDGVLRWCASRGYAAPRIVGVDLDPRHVSGSRARFAGNSEVEIREADFLDFTSDRYDYIIGNPPYVPITGLTSEERNTYRPRFTTAQGRFDLYLLFFERAEFLEAWRPSRIHHA